MDGLILVLVMNPILKWTYFTNRCRYDWLFAKEFRLENTRLGVHSSTALRTVVFFQSRALNNNFSENFGREEIVYAVIHTNMHTNTLGLKSIIIGVTGYIPACLRHSMAKLFIRKGVHLLKSYINYRDIWGNWNVQGCLKIYRMLLITTMIWSWWPMKLNFKLKREKESHACTHPLHTHRHRSARVDIANSNKRIIKLIITDNKRTCTRNAFVWASVKRKCLMFRTWVLCRKGERKISKKEKKLLVARV